MTRAGLLLAVVSYYGLHWLAGVELPTATRAADAGPVVIWHGVEPVRELYGVLAASGGAGAYVVTSGEFTKAAREFARGREIQLIDGSELRKALAAPVAAAGRVQESASPLPAVGSREQRAEPSPVAAVSAEPQVTEQSPACPRCGASMTRRVARTGARAGQSFWGCSTFPSCRGAREIGG